MNKLQLYNTRCMETEYTLVWKKDKYDEDELPLGERIVFSGSDKNKKDKRVVYRLNIGEDYLLETELTKDELNLKELRLLKREEQAGAIQFDIRQAEQIVNEFKRRLAIMQSDPLSDVYPIVNPHIFLTENIIYSRKTKSIEIIDLIEGFNKAIKADFEYIMNEASRILGTRIIRLNPLAIVPYFIMKYFLTANETLSIFGEVEELEDEPAVQRLNRDIDEAIDNINKNIEYINEELKNVNEKRKEIHELLRNEQLADKINAHLDLIDLVDYIMNMEKEMDHIEDWFAEVNSDITKGQISEESIMKKVERAEEILLNMAHRFKEAIKSDKSIPHIRNQEPYTKGEMLNYLQELINIYRGEYSKGDFKYANKEFIKVFKELRKQVNKQIEKFKEELKMNKELIEKMKGFIPYGIQEVNLHYSKRFLEIIKSNLEKNKDKRLYTVLYILERGNWKMFKDISALYRFGIIDKILNLLKDKYKNEDSLTRLIIYDVIDLLSIATFSKIPFHTYIKQRYFYYKYLSRTVPSVTLGPTYLPTDKPIYLSKDIVTSIAGPGILLSVDLPVNLKLRVRKDNSLDYDKKALMVLKLEDISRIFDVEDYRELQFLSTRNFYVNNKAKFLVFKAFLYLGLI